VGTGRYLSNSRVAKSGVLRLRSGFRRAAQTPRKRLKFDSVVLRTALDISNGKELASQCYNQGVWQIAYRLAI